MMRADPSGSTRAQRRQAASARRSRQAEAPPSPQPPPPLTEISTLAQAAVLSQERREFLCSLIGLSLKFGLALLAGVSLVRLADAYQERMERQGELAAVLDLEQAKLARARDRFDRLFATEGEQRLIREQNQWIAPNRLRVVWQSASGPSEESQR